MHMSGEFFEQLARAPNFRMFVSGRAVWGSVDTRGYGVARAGPEHACTPGMHNAADKTLATIQTLRFGIELETIGLHRAALARAIHGVVGGAVREAGDRYSITAPDGRSWQVVPDGSLSGGYRSGEIVSPILGYADLEILQSIVRAVRAAGAKTDPSTGIHIHVGAEQFSGKQVASLVKMVHKQERLIEHALGIAQNRLTSYCRPIEPSFLARLEAARPRDLSAVSTAWYGRVGALPNRYDQSRYHGLNLNSLFFRGTIEFRYFNGTLHAGEIKAYVQFVLALAAKGLNARNTLSKRREFTVATAKYDFRVFLLGLGLIGNEFKTARLHLTKHLAGSAAWKGARRDRRPSAAPPATSTGTGEEPHGESQQVLQTG